MKSSVKALFRAALLALVLFGSIAVFVPTARAQEAAPAAGETKTTVTQKRWIDKWNEGGAIMYPLLACSVIMIWLIVDLWMRTGIAKMAPNAQIQQMQDLFRAGDYVGAYQFAKNNPSPFCDAARVTLSYIGDGQEATEYALLDGVNKINSATQTRINYLSVIGVCSPMIGLTGTVMGMMKAFEKLAGGGGTDPSQLSGAIGEVLIATASGLIIAIPAFMMFYVLRNKLQSTVHEVQELLTALFRKMPYAQLKDCHVGEEEFYAAAPNWITGGAASAEPAHA
jgi:biopolymer transport protein ExbB